MWYVDFPEWNIPCSPHLPHWDLKSPSLSGAHFLKVNLGPTEEKGSHHVRGGHMDFRQDACLVSR
jgi:hypothetical protein